MRHTLVLPCLLAALAAQPQFFTNVQPVFPPSGSQDFAPALNRSETVMIFSSNRAGGQGNYDLWEVRRPNVASPWGTPAPLTALNTPSADYEAGLSDDELELYFVSNRPGSLGYDIWVSTRASTSAAWGAPVNLGAVVNGAGRSLDDPQLTDDGLTLFYTSGESGGGDIYTVTRTARSQPWGNKAAFAPANDPSAFDHSPTPESNGHIVWFGSSRPGTGGWDVWVTWRDRGTNQWTAPIEVKELNTNTAEHNCWRRGVTGTFYFSRVVGGFDQIHVARPVMAEQQIDGSYGTSLLPRARPSWPTQVAWVRSQPWRIQTTLQFTVFDTRAALMPYVTAIGPRLAPAPIALPGWIGSLELDPSPFLVLGSGAIQNGLPAQFRVTAPNDPGLIGFSIIAQSAVVEVMVNRLVFTHVAELTFAQ
jgi:hypothetical protein